MQVCNKCNLDMVQVGEYIPHYVDKQQCPKCGKTSTLLIVEYDAIWRDRLLPYRYRKHEVKAKRIYARRRA